MSMSIVPALGDPKDQFAATPTPSIPIKGGPLTRRSPKCRVFGDRFGWVLLKLTPWIGFISFPLLSEIPGPLCNFVVAVWFWTLVAQGMSRSRRSSNSSIFTALCGNGHHQHNFKHYQGASQTKFLNSECRRSRIPMQCLYSFTTTCLKVLIIRIIKVLDISFRGSCKASTSP